MKKCIATAAVALALGFAAAPATAADKVIMIDQSDVQKLARDVAGFRTSEVIGMDVYGNGGKRIGEIEDFIVAGGGYLYAVVETEDGVLGKYLELVDGETVVVPWNQLRVSGMPQ